MKRNLIRSVLVLQSMAGICVMMSDSPWFPIPNMGGLLLFGASLLAVMALE